MEIKAEAKIPVNAPQYDYVVLKYSHDPDMTGASSVVLVNFVKESGDYFYPKESVKKLVLWMMSSCLRPITVTWGWNVGSRNEEFWKVSGEIIFDIEKGNIDRQTLLLKRG